MQNRDPRGITFRVTGRVQGVAFRWFGCTAAEELAVTGWIRNRPDGGVEGEAYGDRLRLEAFLDRLRQGPTAARVDRLNWEELPAGEAPATFEVRY